MKKSIIVSMVILLIAINISSVNNVYASEQTWDGTYPLLGPLYQVEDYPYQILGYTSTGTLRIHISTNPFYMYSETQYATTGHNFQFLYYAPTETYPNGYWSKVSESLSGQKVSAIVTILENNSPVYTDSTVTTINTPTSTMVGEPATNHDIMADVHFLSPRNGFTDNSYLFNFNTYSTVYFIEGVTFDPTLMEVDILLDDVSIDTYTGTKGYVVNSGVLSTTMSYDYELDFYLEIPEGTHSVKLELKYNNTVIGYDHVNVTRLLGFVDEDGDQLDDRTGREDANSPTEYVTDTNFTLDNVVSSAQGLYDTTKTSFDFMGRVFSTLPSPIPQVLAFILTFSVVFFVIKIVRG